jgi:hypothetical protein
MKTTKTKTNGTAKLTLPRNDPVVRRLLAVATATGRSIQDLVNSCLEEEIPKLENEINRHDPVKIKCEMLFEGQWPTFNALFVAPGPMAKIPHRGARLFLGDLGGLRDDLGGLRGDMDVGTTEFSLSDFDIGAIEEVSLPKALAWYVKLNGVLESSTGNPDTLCAMAAEALSLCPPTSMN